MNFIRRNIGRLVLGLVFLLLVFLVYGCTKVRPEDSQVTPLVVVEYTCNISNGSMTASGSLKNLRTEEQTVRILWSAVSNEEADPPIQTSYIVQLRPQENTDFTHPISNAAPIQERIIVDEDYQCFYLLESA